MPAFEMGLVTVQGSGNKILSVTFLHYK